MATMMKTYTPPNNRIPSTWDISSFPRDWLPCAPRKHLSTSTSIHLPQTQTILLPCQMALSCLKTFIDFQPFWPSKIFCFGQAFVFCECSRIHTTFIPTCGCCSSAQDIHADIEEWCNLKARSEVCWFDPFAILKLIEIVLYYRLY